MSVGIASIVNERPSEAYLAGQRWYLDNVHTLLVHAGIYVAIPSPGMVYGGSDVDSVREQASKGFPHLVQSDIFVERVPKPEELARPYEDPVKAARSRVL